MSVATRDPPPVGAAKRLARIAPHLLAALAAMLLACGPADGAADSAAERAEATLTSRCQATSSQVICSQRELSLTALFVPRKVTFEVPLGTAPAAGWPVAIFYQGSFIAGSQMFTADRGDAFGKYQATLTIKTLLDAGYAVLAPDALLGGATFWQTNIPPWSLLWTTSSDHAFLVAILQAIRGGRFGALNPDRLYALGISSGGFMTSRMAVSYPGLFRALAVHSASYATCSAVCVVPGLPADHPPTLFLHGLLDPIVPLPTMESYRNALQRDGHEVETVINKTASHQWLPEGAQAVRDWFDRHP